MEGRQLGLRDVPNFPILFGRTGLVEAALWCVLANGLEASKRPKAGDVGGHHGRTPRLGNKGHGPEIVEFIGLGG